MNKADGLDGVKAEVLLEIVRDDHLSKVIVMSVNGAWD